MIILRCSLHVLWNAMGAYASAPLDLELRTKFRWIRRHVVTETVEGLVAAVVVALSSC